MRRLWRLLCGLWQGSGKVTARKGPEQLCHCREPILERITVRAGTITYCTRCCERSERGHIGRKPEYEHRPPSLWDIPRRRKS